MRATSAALLERPSSTLVRLLFHRPRPSSSYRCNYFLHTPLHFIPTAHPFHARATALQPRVAGFQSMPGSPVSDID
ncbi:MAG: hypothetical protein ABIQ70_10365 [Dokdonella sp.]